MCMKGILPHGRLCIYVPGIHIRTGEVEEVDERARSSQKNQEHRQPNAKPNRQSVQARGRDRDQTEKERNACFEPTEDRRGEKKKK